MKRNFIIILIVGILTVVAFFIGVTFFKPKPPTIDQLITYFRDQGLTVTDYVQSAEMQQFGDRAENEIAKAKKKLGIEDDPAKNPNQSIDGRPLVVNGIKVYVNVYLNPTIAREHYLKGLTRQEERKRRAEEDGLPYYQTDYFVNGYYLMHVDHWQATLINGVLSMRPNIVTINANDLAKITDTFLGYNR